MAPGSVIVDLAVEAGGNVEGSRPGEIATTANGVRIIGHLNMPSRIAVDASQLYARNLLAFLALLVDKDKQLQIDTSDEIIKAALLTRDGAVVNPALDAATGRSGAQPRRPAGSPPADGERMADPASLAQRAGELAGDAGALARNLDALAQQLALRDRSRRRTRGTPFVFELTVFVLAVFVGYYVVWRVTPALHSPLMSVTNAISSVIIVGALIAAGPVEHQLCQDHGLCRRDLGRGQHLRRLHRDPAHAADVPAQEVAGAGVQR